MEFVKKYAIIWFALAALILNSFASSFAALLKDKYTFLNKNSNSLEVFLKFLLFAILSAIFYLRALSVSYHEKTGRYYLEDKKKFNKSYKELIEFYRDAEKNKLNPKKLPIKHWRRADGIIMGKVDNRLVYRKSSAEGNVAVFGRPGTGKTSALIIPTALRFKGSILAVDIKGDISAITASQKNIKFFQPENPRLSASFNPFENISQLTDTERVDFIRSLAMTLIPEGNAKDNNFFTDGARDLFSGIMVYQLWENINLPFNKALKKMLSDNNVFEWIRLILKSECEDAKIFLSSYFGTNEKNVAGCFNTLSINIAPLTIGGLGELLGPSSNQISPLDLEKGTDIYLKIPQSKIDFYAPVFALIIQNFMDYFMDRPDLSEGLEQRPILFMLDEFPQLGINYQTIASALATLRSKKVSILLACQSIAQLDELYSPEKSRVLMDNCSYFCILSSQDPRSRKYFEELIGSKKSLSVNITDGPNGITKTIQEVREPVIYQEDFTNLNDAIVIYFNGQYIMAEKTFYFKKD